MNPKAIRIQAYTCADLDRQQAIMESLGYKIEGDIAVGYDESSDSRFFTQIMIPQ